MDRLVVNVERGCEAAGRAKQLALAARWGCKPPRFSRGGAELRCIALRQARLDPLLHFAAVWPPGPPGRRRFPAILLQFNWATGRSVWPQQDSSTATFWNPTD